MPTHTPAPQYAAILILCGAAAGCSTLGLGGPSYTGPKDKPQTSTPTTSADANVIELTVNNNTGADICRLHVREDALNDAYGWSSNQLAQRDNPKPIKAGATATIKLQANKPFAKPDLHALDCAGKTIVRVYDKPEFSNAAGSTWTLAAADEGTIAAVQEARGIKKSVHPLARKDAPSSGGGSIEISLENKCGSTVEYCHESTGSSTSSVNGGSSKRLSVNDGDKIKLKSGSSCGQVVHTVSSSSNGASIVLCK